MVSLNIEIIGKKERIIITGTLIDVAVIWFLLARPIVAPKRKEQICPTNIRSINQNKFIPVYPPANPITSEPIIHINIM